MGGSLSPSAAPACWTHSLARPFWSAHTKTLNRNDVIRVVAADGSFDVELTVTGLMTAGVLVELLASHDMAAHLAMQQAVEELRPAVQPTGA